MPELPEVETIRQFLEKAIVTKKITGIEVLSKKQFPQDPKLVIGATISAVDRRGKNLIFRLNNQKNLLIHLKLTGQLIWVPDIKKKMVFDHPIPFAGDELPANSTRVIISLNGGSLFFNELRKFGWIKVVDEKNLPEEIGKLGPDPLGKDFSLKYLEEILSKTSKPVKLVLMDQEKIAGIGNIYANEALFEAKISPQQPAKKLTLKEIKKLHQAIIRVLKEGLLYGGSSGADEAYVRPDGSAGGYQKHFRVYQRDGEKCQKCGETIKRINLGGRGTFFCNQCQH